MLLSSNPGILRVLCVENTVAPYCKSKSIGRLHIIVGSIFGGEADGASNVPVSAAGTGQIGGIRISAAGNIFFTDRYYGSVRAVCFDASEAGFCAGKQNGYFYRVAGTGVRTAPTNNVLAGLETFSNPTDLMLDEFNNVVVSDYDSAQLVKFCFNPDASSSLCNGLTAGNAYIFAGDGSAADTADGVSAASASLSHILHLSAVDGNIFWTDSYYRLRALCLTTVGYCAGKTLGNVYRVAGDGTNADGADNTVANASALGEPRSFAFDSADNVFIGDAKSCRIRAICLNTASGFCFGKTALNQYYIAGTGSCASDVSPGAALATDLFPPSWLDFDSAGNLLFTDKNSARVAALCNSTTAYCAGKAISTLTSVIAAPAADEIPSDGDLANLTLINHPRALSTDGSNNYYFFSVLLRRLYVRCNENVTPASYCHNKIVGGLYLLAGDGTAADGVDDQLASGSSLYELRATAVDSDFNIILADYYAHRVRLICVNAVGRCIGKTVGFIYPLAGTGTAGASDDVAAVNSQIARPASLAFDHQGNLYIYAYNTYKNIWTVCTNVSSGGFCQGKTNGNVYIFAGGGASTVADGLDRLSIKMGRGVALAVDANDNFYWMTNDGETPKNSIHVICRVDPAPAGLCAGKTAGAIYRVAGNLGVGDGAGGVAAATDSMGAASGFGFDTLGNMWIQDHVYSRLRVVCNDVASVGFCQGKVAGNIYRYAGSGMSGTAGNDVNLFAMPMPKSSPMNTFILDRSDNFLFSDLNGKTLFVAAP